MTYGDRYGAEEEAAVGTRLLWCPAFVVVYKCYFDCELSFLYICVAVVIDIII